IGCFASKDVPYRDYSDELGSSPGSVDVCVSSGHAKSSLELDMPGYVHDCARVRSASLKVLSVLSEDQGLARTLGRGNVRSYRPPPVRSSKRDLRGWGLQRERSEGLSAA
ncbi:ORFx, partial [Physalis rugose mosaic virus]